MKKLFSLLLLFLIGCSNLPLVTQQLNPAVYYRHDMCFEYETGEIKEEKIKNFFERFRKGKYRKTQLVRQTAKICGVGVLPNLDEYVVQIQAMGELNFFSLTTCHEETTSENPDSGWFKKKGELKFTYSPTIEKGKACPLYINAYNRKQRHSSGIFIFENPRYQLEAVVNCNGYEESYDGVSICQSRESLIQQIHFNEPVKLLAPVNGGAEREGNCPVIGEDGKKDIEFKLPNRECIYGFIGMESKKVHMLMTIGYENIIIRE